jgi:hypothetical protein
VYSFLNRTVPMVPQSSLCFPSHVVSPPIFGVRHQAHSCLGDLEIERLMGAIFHATGDTWVTVRSNQERQIGRAPTWESVRTNRSKGIDVGSERVRCIKCSGRKSLRFAFNVLFHKTLQNRLCSFNWVSARGRRMCICLSVLKKTILMRSRSDRCQSLITTHGNSKKELQNPMMKSVGLLLIQVLPACNSVEHCTLKKKRRSDCVDRSPDDSKCFTTTESQPKVARDEARIANLRSDSMNTVFD